MSLVRAAVARTGGRRPIDGVPVVLDPRGFARREHGESAGVPPNCNSTHAPHPPNSSTGTSLIRGAEQSTAVAVMGCLTRHRREAAATPNQRV